MTILAFLLLLPFESQARVYIVVDQPSEKKFPIAVTDLTAKGKKSKDWGQKVSQMIRKDLQLTNLFEIIPPEDFPENHGPTSLDPRVTPFSPWNTPLGGFAVTLAGSMM